MRGWFLGVENIKLSFSLIIIGTVIQYFNVIIINFHSQLLPFAGERADTIVYLNPVSGYTYHHDNRLGSKTFRCQYRKSKDCRGRVSVTNLETKIVNPAKVYDHTHPPDPDYIIKYEFRKELLKRSRETVTDVYEIFNDMSGEERLHLIIN